MITAKQTGTETKEAANVPMQRMKL